MKFPSTRTACSTHCLLEQHATSACCSGLTSLPTLVRQKATTLSLPNTMLLEPPTAAGIWAGWGLVTKAPATAERTHNGWEAPLKSSGAAQISRSYLPGPPNRQHLHRLLSRQQQ